MARAQVLEDAVELVLPGDPGHPERHDDAPRGREGWRFPAAGSCHAAHYSRNGRHGRSPRRIASPRPQGGFGNSTRRLRRKGYYPFRNRGTTPFGIGGLPLTLIGVLPLLRKGYYPPPWHRGTTPLGEGVRTPLGKGVLPPFRKRRCRHFEPALGLHSPRRNRPFAEIQDKGEMTKWPSAGEAATMCGAHTCFHDFHVHMHPDGRWRTRHLPVGAEEPVQRAAGGREPGRNLK